MDYKLNLTDEAKADIVKGFQWYEGRREGLGTRFIDEVEEVFDYIERYPEHYQNKYKNYREGILKIFPYLITYEIIGKLGSICCFPNKGQSLKKASVTFKKIPHLQLLQRTHHNFNRYSIISTLNSAVNFFLS